MEGLTRSAGSAELSNQMRWLRPPRGHKRGLMLVSAMNAGGAECLAATLCNGWAERGHSVCLVATDSSGGESQCRLHETVLWVWVAGRVPFGRRRFIGYLSQSLGLRWRARDIRADVPFLTIIYILTLGALPGLQTSVIFCESIDPGAARNGLLRLNAMRQYWYRMTDLVTVQTGAASQKRIVPRMRGVEAVANSICLNSSKSSVRPIDRPAGAGESLLSGASQNRGRWITSLTRSPPAQRGFPMSTYGAGARRSLREPLLARPRGAGLDSRDFVPGRTTVPLDDTWQADVLLMPSIYVGIPNVLQEATARDLAPVAYGGSSIPREKSERGCLTRAVALCDRNGLAEAAAGLLSDPETAARLGRIAAQWGGARYTLPATLQRWDIVISQAQSARADALASEL
jgi:GalNAc-alpha-(1->4)-GalNAc-alpha-(1->3)-diNAcBac-PP-undecaprenol alpha-1,4-N-acetyl-D-galactosaminyltransferase